MNSYIRTFNIIPVSLLMIVFFYILTSFFIDFYFFNIVFQSMLSFTFEYFFTIPEVSYITHLKNNKKTTM